MLPIPYFELESFSFLKLHFFCQITVGPCIQQKLEIAVDLISGDPAQEIECFLDSNANISKNLMRHFLRFYHYATPQIKLFIQWLSAEGSRARDQN